MVASANGNGRAAMPANRFPVDLEAAPTITLAGMTFPIPTLSVRENRVVVPILFKLEPMLAAVRAEGLKAKAARDAGAEIDPGWTGRIDLTTEAFDLMCHAVHTAITRGQPGFGRGEFDGMPISVDELIVALFVIQRQTRMLRKVEEAAQDKGPLPMPSAAGASGGDLDQVDGEGNPIST